MIDDAVSPFVGAPQQGPRPLPLFIAMLQQQTATSPEFRSAALKGLVAYQSAARHDLPVMPPPARHYGRATLRDYGGAGRPILFIPSLINPPFILDLSPQTSLLRWLCERGHRCLLVDWGTPDVAARNQDLAAHVAEMLLPMIAALDQPPVLVGYCLGGTLALAAAQLGQVAAVATIASPWHFDGYGERSRQRIARMWADARPTCEQLGLVPMEVLQSGFWQLGPEQTIAKYAKFGALAPGSDAARRFVALEDWANAGAPLTLGVGQDLFERMIAADRPGRGEWTVAGQAIDPTRITCPAINFVSATDRIVPAASAPRHGRSETLAAGHVGMIVGSGGRRDFWPLLDDWLSAVAAPR